MNKIACFSLVVLATSIFAAAPNEPAKAAINAVDAADLLEHIKILGSDKFEGRAPGAKGEKESVKYITAQFRKLGLKPGNPNGTYTQEVPLAGILGAPTAPFAVGDKRMELHSPNEFAAFTQRITP